MGTKKKKKAVSIAVGSDSTVEEGEKFTPLNSETEIDCYINSHRQWWKIGLLQRFVDRIPKLVSDRKLMYYFSLQIGKLRNRIKDELFNKDVETEQRKRKWKQVIHPDIEDGDIYGKPRFFRYGEGGRSKKKRNSSGFMYKDE